MLPHEFSAVTSVVSQRIDSLYRGSHDARLGGLQRDMFLAEAIVLERALVGLRGHYPTLIGDDAENAGKP